MDSAQTMQSLALEDRISALPSDLLAFTLTLLPLREAARTSILARKWRSVWKASVSFSSCLNLDVLTMRGRNYRDDVSSRYEMDDMLSIETSKFIRWVDQISQLDHGPVIDSFKIQFNLKKEFAHIIDRFIKMAITKKVINVDIDLSHFFWQSSEPNGDLYTFPSWFFTQETGSIVKCLSLKTCVFGPFDGINSFHYGSLVVLHLEYAFVNGDDFSKCLSSFPNLEHLWLADIWNLHKLEILGPLHKLKVLIVVECSSLKEIVIESKSLIKLEYAGAPVRFTFLDVPKLHKVIICITLVDFSAGLSYALGKLSADLPKLEEMLLTIDPVEKSKFPTQPPLFANLRKLVLVSIFYGKPLWNVIHLVCASPNLQRLDLHLNDTIADSEVADMPNESTHFHLKEINFTGYAGTPHELEVTKYLVRNCTVLEKITIDYTQFVYTAERGIHVVVYDLGTEEDLAIMAIKDAEKKKEMQMLVYAQVVNQLRPGTQLALV